MVLALCCVVLCFVFAPVHVVPLSDWFVCVALSVRTPCYCSYRPSCVYVLLLLFIGVLFLLFALFSFVPISCSCSSCSPSCYYDEPPPSYCYYGFGYYRSPCYSFSHALRVFLSILIGVFPYYPPFFWQVFFSWFPIRIPLVMCVSRLIFLWWPWCVLFPCRPSSTCDSYCSPCSVCPY